MADVLALINGSYRVIASGLPSRVADAIKNDVSSTGGRALVNHHDSAPREIDDWYAIFALDRRPIPWRELP